MLGSIIWAVIVGVILGYLGKLLLPGKQDIPAWSTIGAGIVAALLGTWVASWFGVDETSGVDWFELLFQIVFAVVAIYVVTRMFGNRRISGRGTANY